MSSTASMTDCRNRPRGGSGLFPASMSSTASAPNCGCGCCCFAGDEEVLHLVHRVVPLLGHLAHEVGELGDGLLLPPQLLPGRLQLRRRSAPPPMGCLLALTDDLLAELLVRVPSPADLARASASCASLRRVATSPRFLRRFRSLRAPPPLGVFFPDGASIYPALPPTPLAPTRRAATDAPTRRARRDALCDEVATGLERTGGEVAALHTLHLLDCIVMDEDLDALLFLSPRLRVLVLRHKLTTWPGDHGWRTVHSAMLEELAMDSERAWARRVDVVAPALKQLVVSFGAYEEVSISVAAPMVEKFWWHCCYAVETIGFGLWSLHMLTLQTPQRQGELPSLQIYAGNCRDVFSDEEANLEQEI